MRPVTMVLEGSWGAVRVFDFGERARIELEPVTGGKVTYPKLSLDSKQVMEMLGRGAVGEAPKKS